MVTHFVYPSRYVGIPMTRGVWRSTRLYMSAFTSSHSVSCAANMILYEQGLV